MAYTVRSADKKVKQGFVYRFHYKTPSGSRRSISATSFDKLKNRVVNELGYEWSSEYDC